MVRDQAKLMRTELNKTSANDIDKIYFYAKNPSKSKYQLLINRREKVGIEKLKQIQKDSLMQTVDDVYKSL